MNIREWTLPVYTILTQLSVGALMMLWIIRTRNNTKLGVEKVDRTIKIPVLIIFSTILFAAFFAHMHLSKPYFSILALRNLESSWLSREILANLFYLIFMVFLLVSLWSDKDRYRLTTFLGWLAVLSGFATEFCMSRIYLLPSQPAWNSAFTPASFLASTFLLGGTTIPVLLSMDLTFKQSQQQEHLTVHSQLIAGSLRMLAFIVVGVGILMSIIIFFQTAYLFNGDEAARTSLHLLLKIYQPLLILRLLLLFFGVGWLAFTAERLHRRKVSPDKLLMHGFIACLLVMVAEILGRFLFYAVHVKIGL